MAKTPFPNAPGAASSGAVMASLQKANAKKKRRKKAKKVTKAKPKPPAQPSNVDMALSALKGVSAK